MDGFCPTFRDGAPSGSYVQNQARHATNTSDTIQGCALSRPRRTQHEQHPTCRRRPNAGRNDRCHGPVASQHNRPWSDECRTCNNGGKLWCCSYCPNAYHRTCSNATKAQLALDIWRCDFCRDNDVSKGLDVPYTADPEVSEAIAKAVATAAHIEKAKRVAAVAAETIAREAALLVEQQRTATKEAAQSAQTLMRDAQNDARDLRSRNRGKLLALAALLPATISMEDSLGETMRPEILLSEKLTGLIDGFQAASDRFDQLLLFGADSADSCMLSLPPVSESDIVESRSTVHERTGVDLGTAHMFQNDFRPWSSELPEFSEDQSQQAAEGQWQAAIDDTDRYIQAEQQAQHLGRAHKRWLHRKQAALRKLNEAKRNQRSNTDTTKTTTHGRVVAALAAAYNEPFCMPEPLGALDLEHAEQEAAAEAFRIESRREGKANTESREMDAQDDTHQHNIPEWVGLNGSRPIPLGGLGRDDGVWVQAFATGEDKHVAADVPLPRSYQQARMSRDWPSWERAVKAELAQLEAKHAFQISSYAAVGDNALLGTTWVFTVKDAIDPITGAATIKFKARLTVRGDQQKAADIDPMARSSPTVDIESIRMILAALAADPLTEHIQFDVVGAYLNAKLDPLGKPIFLRIPEGFQGAAPGSVLLLKINLYGLVTAAYAWYQEISKTLQAQGWTRSDYDGCVWSRVDSPSSTTYLLLHVDDGIIVGRNTKLHYDALAAVYELKFLGRPETFLGLQFEFLEGGKILLHQHAFVRQMLRHWAEHPDHPMATDGVQDRRELPFKQGTDLRNDNKQHAARDCSWYRELLGGLNWLLQTRPDLSVAVMFLARGLGHHTHLHDAAAHDLLRHIATTADFGLLIGRLQGASSDLVAFSDTSFGGNKETGLADQGCAVFVQGTLVYFKASPQKSATSNVFEAELLAFSNTSTQVMRLRNYARSFQRTLVASTKIYVDNRAVVRYSENVGLARATRHLSQADHYGRDCCLKGHTRAVMIAGRDNVADMLTKMLPKEGHCRHRDTMGVFSRQAMLAEK